MNKIKILDCTLRDGGYINNWEFGELNIQKLITNLIKSDIDIIECGFITNKDTNKHQSLYNHIEDVKEYYKQNHIRKSLLVCMINYGDYDIENLPEYNKSLIDGIRVAFHKRDKADALQLCKAIKKKGYKLFMQPMVSVSYTDEEFVSLIKEANDINPYAFYIVDSFGVMKRNDLLRFFYLVDHNLLKNILIGYHSHNNIQMAYANAQTLVDIKTKRKIIIDSSIFGMGRGAGNLNTELFLEYLNENNVANYDIIPILKVIDDIINPIYFSNYWGYSLPHYISAKYNCHPNYATYLNGKNTLTIENINDILSNINENMRNTFNQVYIEELYEQFQISSNDMLFTTKKIENIFKSKSVLIIAPGSSINSERQTIKDFQERNNNNLITIAINFHPELISCDYIFYSNNKRFENRNITDDSEIKLIVASNIKNVFGEEFIVDYSKLTNEIACVEDNAGLMLIKLLMDLKVKSIYLAGLDGYSDDIFKDYANPNLAFVKMKADALAMNEGLQKKLKEYSNTITIKMVTKPRKIEIS